MWWFSFRCSFGDGSEDFFIFVSVSVFILTIVFKLVLAVRIYHEFFILHLYSYFVFMHSYWCVSIFMHLRNAFVITFTFMLPNLCCFDLYVQPIHSAYPFNLSILPSVQQIVEYIIKVVVVSWYHQTRTIVLSSRPNLILPSFMMNIH